MLRVEGLARRYAVRGDSPFRPRWLHALDGVDLSIESGETLGLVGESGSGKSTAGRCILRLEEPSAGRVSLDGVSVTDASGEALRRLRRRMQMVYQDPLDSLNPRLRVGTQVAEPIWLHGLAPRAEADRRGRELLELVGLSGDLGRRYPHQLSGGQQQRVAIARALACEPTLLILDEPTSSLDVSIQAQIMRLLADLQARLGLAYLLISHDLALVGLLAHRVAVIYLGQIVEEGPTEVIFSRPAHPYTRALLGSTPRDFPGQERPRAGGALLRGEPTSAVDPPATCRLHPRCPYARPECLQRPATLEIVSAGHAVRCVRFLDENHAGVWEPAPSMASGDSTAAPGLA